MKKFNQWNHDLNQIPNINELIMLGFRNGMKTNINKPYKVEEINYHDRGDFKVITIEGRQVLKSGKLTNNWFQIFITNRPAHFSGWTKEEI